MSRTIDRMAHRGLKHALAVAAWLASAATAAASVAATPTAGTDEGVLAAGAYPLDDIERTLAARGPVRCPTVAKVRYAGTTLRYHHAVMVATPFVAQLAAFEEIVAATAVAHYGRVPSKIRHIGTHNCRRIAAWPTFLSEHGLANGIDVAAFEFGPAPRALAAGLAPALRRGFVVGVKRHWRSDAPADAAHRAFLHDLGRRLVAARGVFRVVLGPGYPGHEDHLHLDCAPWRLVDIALDPAPGGDQARE